MNIQSLSVCVPAHKCINDCKFCCSKMHGGEYEDKFSSIKSTMAYVKDLEIRMRYARNKGCDTLMLTGNNEPQQNKDFLRVLGIVNQSLRNPFLSIEMQTSGSFIDDDTLDFLKGIGVTTIAISVACIDSDEVNRDIIQTPDKDLCIRRLCNKIKERHMNLRICLNMNDNMLTNWENTPGITESVMSQDALNRIIKCCKEFHADQIICRKLWTSETDTPQSDWISKNVTSKTLNFIENFKKQVKENGIYMNTLEYGAGCYNHMGFSTVIDEDCMAKEARKDGIKYLIIRPDGHLYSKWDSKASLIF